MKFPFFKSRQKSEETRSLAHPVPDDFRLFGAPSTAAGIAVGPDTALRSPTAAACIRAIAETIGTLPVHVFTRTDAGRERDTAHPAAGLLAGDANPWTGSAELRTALQVDALLHGRAFALAIRSGGRVRELHRLDPSAVTVETDEAGEPSFRIILKAGGQRVYPWQDILFIQTPGGTVDRPISLTSLAREAIGIDLAMAEHQARIFGNGARPSGVLEYPKALSPEVAKRLRASFDAQHAGAVNGGKTLILEDGMAWKPVQFNSVDLQFLELRRFAVQEIARTYRVPGTLIGDLERATWRNVEELSRQFLTFTLLPWLDVWEAALCRVLFTPRERASRFLEFVTDDLLRGDVAARFDALGKAVGAPWMTPDEARALENRPPIKGGNELVRQAGQTGASPQPEDTPQ